MASSFSNYMNQLDNFIGQNETINKYLTTIEKKTNIKKRYIALAGILLVSVYLVIGLAKELLCNLIGFVYPAYISVKAIESNDKNDDTEWLMYWVVFASFSCVEFFSDILLSWFPFYFLGKCIFLIWCMSPGSYNGWNVIYTRIIRPFVLRHESKIDGALNKAMGGAKDLWGSAKEEANNAVAQATSAAVKQALSQDKEEKND
jgi:receptor expression-enhancing protein 5/6